MKLEINNIPINTIRSKNTLIGGILAIFGVTFSPNTLASCEESSTQTIEVYCTDSNGDTWGWLRYPDQRKYTVQGRKGSTQNITGTFIKYLRVSRDDYTHLKEMCEYAAWLGNIPEAVLPRPAWGWNLSSYMFADDYGLIQDGGQYTEFDGNTFCD